MFPSIFTHRRCLDALACPPSYFVSSPSGFLLLSGSWRSKSFSYLYPHPSPGALLVQHSVTVLSCPGNIDSHCKWKAALPIMDVKWPRNLYGTHTGPLSSEALHVCPLLLESSSSGTCLLTTLWDSAQISLASGEPTLIHKTKSGLSII